VARHARSLWSRSVPGADSSQRLRHLDAKFVGSGVHPAPPANASSTASSLKPPPGRSFSSTTAEETDGDDQGTTDHHPSPPDPRPSLRSALTNPAADPPRCPRRALRPTLRLAWTTHVSAQQRRSRTRRRRRCRACCSVREAEVILFCDSERFRSKAAFARCNGTAPQPASSGQTIRPSSAGGPFRGDRRDRLGVDHRAVRAAGHQRRDGVLEVVDT
jgi:hypothetical protein